MAVALYHCFAFYAVGPKLHWLGEAGLNAHLQVVFFFVLSGLVLTSSLANKPATIGNYLVFGIRRVARIYPALWVAVVAACLYLFLRHYLPPAHNRSAWAVGFDEHDVTSRDVIGSLLGARNLLVPPFWSIKAELIASIALPVMAWLAFSRGRMPYLLYGVAIALGIYSLWAGLDGQYLVDFAIGAIAMRWVSRRGDVGPVRGYAPLCIAILLAALFFRRLDANWTFAADYHAPIPALVEGAGAALFLIVLLSADLSGSFLLAPSLVWLGDISYSLYLLHFPVMELNSRLLPLAIGHVEAVHPDMAALLLAFATLVIVLPLCSLCYRYVELPGIRAGSWAIRRLSGIFASDDVARPGTATRAGLAAPAMAQKRRRPR